MGMMLNRRRVCGGGEKNYTLVDWIENTYANSRIVTNVDVVDSNNYKFVGVITPIRYNRQYTPFFVNSPGTDTTNKRWRFSWSGAPVTFSILTNSSTGGAQIQLYRTLVGIKTSFEITYQKAIINGTTYTTTISSTGTFKPNTKIILAENTSNAGTMKWHELDVYLDGMLISKLRPCLTKDGVYTMVDLLTDYICPTVGNGPWTGGFDN